MSFGARLPTSGQRWQPCPEQPCVGQARSVILGVLRMGARTAVRRLAQRFAGCVQQLVQRKVTWQYSLGHLSPYPQCSLKGHSRYLWSPRFPCSDAAQAARESDATAVATGRQRCIRVGLGVAGVSVHGDFRGLCWVSLFFFFTWPNLRSVTVVVPDLSATHCLISTPRALAWRMCPGASPGLRKSTPDRAGVCLADPRGVLS